MPCCRHKWRHLVLPWWYWAQSGTIKSVVLQVREIAGPWMPLAQPHLGGCVGGGGGQTQARFGAEASAGSRTCQPIVSVAQGQICFVLLTHTSCGKAMDNTSTKGMLDVVPLPGTSRQGSVIVVLSWAHCC